MCGRQHIHSHSHLPPKVMLRIFVDFVWRLRCLLIVHNQSSISVNPTIAGVSIVVFRRWKPRHVTNRNSSRGKLPHLQYWVCCCGRLHERSCFEMRRPLIDPPIESLWFTSAAFMAAEAIQHWNRPSFFYSRYKYTICIRRLRRANVF